MVKNIIKKSDLCDDLIIENVNVVTEEGGGANKLLLPKWYQCLSPFGVKNKFIYLPFDYLLTNNIIYFFLENFIGFIVQFHRLEIQKRHLKNQLVDSNQMTIVIVLGPNTVILEIFFLMRCLALINIKNR
jgi:hypothetical protein